MDHFTTAMTEEASDFTKLLELDYDIFVIKGYGKEEEETPGQPNPNEGLSPENKKVMNNDF